MDKGATRQPAGPRPSISPALLNEFKRIYLAEFSEELSDLEALSRATNLVNLFRAIYRPIPRAQADVYMRLRKCYKDDVTAPPCKETQSA